MEEGGKCSEAERIITCMWDYPAGKELPAGYFCGTVKKRRDSRFRRDYTEFGGVR